MILPIDRGRFDFERERDFDDLMFSVFPDWVWHCPKRLYPVVRNARKSKVDGFQACEGDIFIRRPKRHPASLPLNKHGMADVTRGIHCNLAEKRRSRRRCDEIPSQTARCRDGRNDAVPSIHILQNGDSLQTGGPAQGRNRRTLARANLQQKTA